MISKRFESRNYFIMCMFIVMSLNHANLVSLF